MLFYMGSITDFLMLHGPNLMTLGLSDIVM